MKKIFNENNFNESSYKIITIFHNDVNYQCDLLHRKCIKQGLHIKVVVNKWCTNNL